MVEQTEIEKQRREVVKAALKAAAEKGITNHDELRGYCVGALQRRWPELTASDGLWIAKRFMRG